MGFIKAFSGAISGSFADQWKDFFVVPRGVSATAGLFPAVRKFHDSQGGQNTKHSHNIITDGSKILVPDNMALVTIEDGSVSGFISDPGGYIYDSEAVESSSFFAGGGLVESVIKNSWERFKFGGIPGAQQLAFYVNLKEIPNNRFGTQNITYYDDAYLGTQVGLVAHGAYSLKITDPITFVKNFVPIRFVAQKADPFDFADQENDAVEQLFKEVTQSLSAAFAGYANNADRSNRITHIQADSAGFAQSLSAAIEKDYRWGENRGLSIASAALQSIGYDEDSKALLADVQKADALMGARGNSFMQQSAARSIEELGSNPDGGGALGIGMMGMGVGSVSGIMSGMQQPAEVKSVMESTSMSEDPYEKLTKLKELLDKEVITQEDFDTAKKNLLGL